MRPSLLPVTFLLAVLFSSCTKENTAETRLSDNICTCGSVLQMKEDQISEKYRKEIYPLEKKAILYTYKENYFFPTISSLIDQLGKSRHLPDKKEIQQKTWKVLRGLIQWELEQLNLREKSRLLFILDKPVEQIGTVELQELEKAIGSLKQHYRQLRMNTERRRDEDIKDIIKKEGMKKIAENGPPLLIMDDETEREIQKKGSIFYRENYFDPPMLFSVTNSTYDCILRLLIGYFERDGKATLIEMKRQLKEKGGPAFLF